MSHRGHRDSFLHPSGGCSGKVEDVELDQLERPREMAGTRGEVHFLVHHLDWNSIISRMKDGYGEEVR
jgi:hypothetical protein